MYLRGGKLNMKKRTRRPSNPLLIALLVVAIGALIYFRQVVVPEMPTLFMPSPTPTRSQGSLLNERPGFFKAGRLSQAIDSYKRTPCWQTRATQPPSLTLPASKFSPGCTRMQLPMPTTPSCSTRITPWLTPSRLPPWIISAGS